LSIDGEFRVFPADEFTTMSFQNNIVMFVHADELHNASKCYGTWTSHDGILSLNFNHYSSDIAEGTEVFAAPSWIDIPGGISDYQISKLSSTWLELIRVADGGSVYIYKFKKTW